MSNYVTESLMFLAIARNTICESLKYEDIPEGVDEIKNFIKNEASDYQIMEILVTGTLPDEKYNYEREYRLWEAFKKQLVRNRSMLAESMDETVIDDLIFEMGPVFDYGLSSAKPILEFHNEMGLIPVLSELTFGGAKSHEGKKLYQKKSLWGKTKAQARGYKGIASDKAQSVIAKGKGIATDVKANAPGAIYAAGTKVGTAALKGKEKAQGLWKKAKEAPTWKKVTGGLTAVAGAAAIAYGAYQLYKNYLSQAARACKGKPDKAACMKQFKDKAQKAKVAKLQQGMATCAKSKNPDSCKKTLAAKIAKEKAKMSA